jgi:hypothetical protein
MRAPMILMAEETTVDEQSSSLVPPVAASCSHPSEVFVQVNLALSCRGSRAGERSAWR